MSMFEESLTTEYIGPWEVRRCRESNWMEILVNDEIGDSLAESALFNVIHNGWVGGESILQRWSREKYRYKYMYVRTVLDSAEKYAWGKLAEQEIKVLAWASALAHNKRQAERPLPHEESCECGTCYW